MAMGIPEPGMGYLTSKDWLPPAIDPARFLENIDSRFYEAARGHVSLEATSDIRLDNSNIIERLGTAYALLRGDEAAGRRVHNAVFETLEALGFEVSAAFAERGSDAHYLIKTIHGLQSGEAISHLMVHMAYQSLGRLWAAAFSAPPGFDHYISHSASGGEQPDLSFFSQQRPKGMSGPEEGEYLLNLANMLQAAVAAKELPAVTVGQQLSFSEWRAPAWAIYLPRQEGRAWRLVIHSLLERLGPNCERHTVKLVEDSSGETIASIRAVVMEGDTGSYDDFISMGPLGGANVERVINSVFAPDQVISLYPRVRWLLESTQNRLFRLLVLEGMYAAPLWRHRKIGNVLLQQLLVETTMVDVAIGRPMAFTDPDESNLPFGVQAGYAVAKLALARYFAQMGGEFLMSGTMGMQSRALRVLHAAGEAARLQQ